MYVLGMAEPKGFFVVANEEAKALVADWFEKRGEVFEAGVGYVVEPGEILWVHGPHIEPLVMKIDALGKITHAYPFSTRVEADFVEGPP